MYSVYAYGTMIQPGPRVDAYLAAMRAAIRPGCTVIDLGCGPGFFTLMACKLGAGKVYAIEPDPAIAVAKEIATASGYADRIEFFQETSQKVSLPQKADVIVSDLRGVMPLFTHHLPSIVDARQRLLAPGGVLIPQKDTLWIAPVENAELYQSHAEPWKARDGVNLEAGRRIAANAWRKAKIESAMMLAPPARWAELDYRTVTSPNVAGQAEWKLPRSGTCHGYAMWFDAELGGDVRFSNAPGEPELVYGQAFYPLAEPAVLAARDVIKVDLHAHLVGDDYTWVWNTDIRDPAGTSKARHAQSSFNATALSPQTLRKRELSFRPALGEDGELVAGVLRRMDGTSSLDQVAQELLRSHPGRFANLAEAQRFVGDLAVKYAR